MGSKGKGRRRRELNFKDAHASSSLSRLPPAPSLKDAAAIPSKLRKLMQLKAASTRGSASDFAKGHGEGFGRGEANRAIKRSKNKKVSVQSAPIREKTLERTQGPVQVQQVQPPAKSNEEASASANKIRRRGDDMKMLMDTLGVAPVRKGIREHRKRFLEDKKSRKKQKLLYTNALAGSLHQRESIKFGDVVLAPPKLSRPVKPSREAESSGLFQQRITLQTVEAYRQRKGWVSRPGTNIPFKNAPELS